MLYCWEVQVEERAQRKGLGRFLMQLLELIARRCASACPPAFSRFNLKDCLAGFAPC